jgi:hypothetical protein
VLAELATKGFLSVLPAAPPHLTSPLALMCAAGPVVVFLLQVLLSALLTDLLVVVDAESAILELGDPLLHLVTLHLQLLCQFYLSLEVIPLLFEISLECSQISL